MPATIAELGAASSEDYDGCSLVPTFSETVPHGWRRRVLIEQHVFGWHALRANVVDATGAQRQFVYVEYDTGELYDMAVEPYEIESLHASAEVALLSDLSGA